MITIIITGVIALIVGFVLGYLLINMTLKYRSKNIIKEAEAEAEVIKKDKILQAKEKFLQIKAEHEKQVNARNSKILLAENKLKQKDAELARKMEECQRKIKDAETQQETLEAQKELLEKKHAELDKFKKQQIEQLEAISGMSADQAKEKLISSLKDEAETEAMSYVNEIMEEAKMTANMEAKKIVVKTIQRVATETATENAVSIFHIDSDEIKGRIIGREGRNIRALEAATGVEIIVDDTPEAIVLSGFDPVRREIARLSLHQLVTDGRIHPARIEEVVNKVKKTNRGRDRRDRETHHHRLGYSRVAPGINPVGRQNEIPFFLRAKLITTRSRNSQPLCHHGRRIGLEREESKTCRIIA